MDHVTLKSIWGEMDPREYWDRYINTNEKSRQISNLAEEGTDL